MQPAKLIVLRSNSRPTFYQLVRLVKLGSPIVYLTGPSA
jgi:hypothetical protein